MSIIKPNWSIRRVFLLSIIGVVTLIAMGCIAVISQQHSKSYQTVEANQVVHWANIVADESLNYLINTERQALSDNFSLPAHIPHLNYLQIFLF